MSIVYWRRLKPEEVIRHGDFVANYSNFDMNGSHEDWCRGEVYQKVMIYPAIGFVGREKPEGLHVWRAEGIVLDQVENEPIHTERKIEPEL